MIEPPALNAPYVEWALWYARKGIPVFPLSPKTKIPFSKSKGVHDATTDEAQIRKWWAKAPGANIGAACGVKFDVLDVDAGGAATFEQHDNKAKVVAATKTVKGGTHIFYDVSVVPLSNGVKKLPGLDVRTKGGYVVMPPSFVCEEVDGQIYEGHYSWREGMQLNGQPLPPFPAWAARAFRADARKEKPNEPDLTEGGRNDGLFRIGCGYRSKGMEYSEIFAALSTLNASRCKPPLEEKEVDKIARSCVTYETNSYELPPKGTLRLPSAAIGNGARRLRKASEIEGATVDWLIFPYLPKGMLVGLEGDPGLGKTFVLLAFAAALSLGRTVPYIDSPIAKGTTLFFTLDDSAEYTIKPRLERMEADLNCIFIDDQQLTLNPAGLEELRNLILEYKASWVVLDPLAKFVDPVIKSPRPEISLSEIMTELKNIAEETKCTITPNRHLKKGRDDNPIYAGYGGIEIIGGYRSALRIDRDPDHPPLRGSSFGIVSHIKNNVGPIGHSFGYEIRPVNKTLAEILFTGLSDFNPQDAPPVKLEQAPEIKDAKSFLLHELGAGQAELATAMFALAKRQGISEKTLRKAREALCTTERIGFGEGSKVFWRLKQEFVREDPHA